MAKLNGRIEPLRTHEGAVAKRIKPIDQLRRSVLACLLWEDTFYEGGVSIATRVEELIPQCDPKAVADMVIQARSEMNLRHMPLWMARIMAKTDTHKKYVKSVLGHIIQRADELPEFLKMYWKDGKQPLSAQVKKGLANAFTKFDEYKLAKYNRATEIKLRDVLFLCHAKPKDDKQADLWKRLVNDTLAIPDTWEVKTSAKDVDQKKEWTNLLEKGKLGAMALLRNLRNLIKHRVDINLIRKSLHEMNPERVLPFRFISAAQAVPELEDALEVGMLKCLSSHKKLPGETVLLIDVSGSMDWKLSDNSVMNRIDAACGLSILLREICEDVRIYTFSHELVQVPPRRGFALRDAITTSQRHSGTCLGAAVKAMYSNDKPKQEGWRAIAFNGQNLRPDRLIVMTDEQSHDKVPDPVGVAYMINVASYKNGVGYGPWINCSGWSASVVTWIQELESKGLV